MSHPPKKKAGTAFENISFTPQIAEGYNLFSVLRAFFSKPKATVPASPLPALKTELQSYHSEKPSITWFGHSSYLVHAAGFNILVDPVLSGYASPVSFYIRAFKGADIYKPADMPPIDVLVLTHNHYDHLDIHTLKLLAGKIKKYIVPAGVAQNLKSIGVKADQITELNWWQGTPLSSDSTITATPARHFSGRSLRRNGSLWASYVLAINGYKIFIGGDSGYDTHFKDIGQQFGPFDLALLECGQYNVMWPYIHSMPEELITEAADLQAKAVMPVHWGKFALAMHDWKEPVSRFVEAAEKAGLTYTTPLIGQPVVLGEKLPVEHWWEGLQ